MRTNRLWDVHFMMNRMELDELERLQEVLGTSSKSETVRLAIKLTLANRTMELPDDISSDSGVVGMYAQMMTNIRVALFKITSLGLDAKQKAKKKMYQAEAKAIKELIQCLITARKEEYFLKDIVSSEEYQLIEKTKKDMELKERSVKVQEEALEHKKNIDILDRS